MTVAPGAPVVLGMTARKTKSAVSAATGALADERRCGREPAVLAVREGSAVLVVGDSQSRFPRRPLPTARDMSVSMMR